RCLSQKVRWGHLPGSFRTGLRASDASPSRRLAAAEIRRALAGPPCEGMPEVRGVAIVKPNRDLLVRHARVAQILQCKLHPHVGDDLAISDVLRFKLATQGARMNRQSRGNRLDARKSPGMRDERALDFCRDTVVLTQAVDDSAIHLACHQGRVRIRVTR